MPQRRPSELESELLRLLLQELPQNPPDEGFPLLDLLGSGQSEEKSGSGFSFDFLKKLLGGSSDGKELDLPGDQVQVLDVPGATEFDPGLLPPVITGSAGGGEEGNPRGFETGDGGRANDDLFGGVDPRPDVGGGVTFPQQPGESLEDYLRRIGVT